MTIQRSAFVALAFSALTAVVTTGVAVAASLDAQQAKHDLYQSRHIKVVCGGVLLTVHTDRTDARDFAMKHCVDKQGFTQFEIVANQDYDPEY